MQKSTEIRLSTMAVLCVGLAVNVSACTIHEESQPPAQTAPAPVYAAPAPAPAPVYAAPASAPPATQTGTIYRPTVEAPTAANRAPGTTGVASAPPASAPPANGVGGPAVAPPANGALSGGYADDPAITVNGAPPAPRPELTTPSPGVGYAWVPGHWAWRGSWVWVGGSYKPIPAGHRQWVPGVWVNQGATSRWQPGHWA